MQDNSSNSDGYARELPGGVTRYTVGQPIPSSLTIGQQGDNQAQPTSGGNVNGTFTHTSGQGVTHSEHSSVNAAALMNRGSVLGTFVNAGGSPSSNYAENGSVCLDPGNESSRTSVAAAITMGYLKRSDNGTLVDAMTLGQAEAGVKELSSPAKDEQPEFDLFDPATERQWVAALAPHQQPITDAAHASGALAVTQGRDTESIVDHLSAQLARDAGGSPEEHRKTVQLGIDGYTRQVHGLLHSEGIPRGEEDLVWQWARENDRDGLAHALNQLTFGRSLSGFRSLLDGFYQSASPSPEALKSLGFNVRGSGREATVERDDGGWMPVADVRYPRGK